MEFDVLVVGELNVDIILNKIDGPPEIGKEKLASEFTTTLGSSSAIFASNLSTLGVKVGFAGKVGTDAFGDLVLNALRAKGVNTKHIIRTSAYQTGATVVMNYDLDRAMVTYPGAMEHLHEAEISDAMLQNARHLHVSSVFLQPALKKGLLPLFKRAKAAGITTSMDPQWDPAEKWELNLQELLPYVDVFLPNRKELKLLTNTSSLTAGVKALESVAHIIAVKDGENGAALFEKGEIHRQEAFLNTDVADAIGAGDSFDAGFISQFIQGKSLQACLEFANLTGAINTTRPGGTTAFSSLDEVKSIALQQFSYTF